jgi:hypothetical protein
MPRKVFTAGEVLAAADVNEFLMDQVVQSFAGTAARGSAIPTPVTGMTTYLEDTKDLRVYDGSAYSSPFGMTHLRTTEFTAQSSVSIDNVFTSEFDNYKVYVTQINSNNAGFRTRLRTAAAADIDSADYQVQELFVSGTTVSAIRFNNQNTFDNGGARSTGQTFLEITITNPLQAQPTIMSSSIVDATASASTINTSFYGCRFTATTAASGFRIFPGSGDMTGKVSVYGMRK